MSSPVADPASEREIFHSVVKYGELIETLRNGPLYKRELSNTLDVSESTVYRRTKRLIDLSLVCRGSDGYELTNTGELYAAWYKNARRDTKRLYQSREVFEVCDLDLPYQMFKDSTVVASKQFAPDRPIKRIEKVVQSSRTIRGLSPVVVDSYAKLFTSQLRKGNLNAELIFQSTATEYLKSEYPSMFEVFRGKDDRLLESDADFSFGLLIAENPDQRAILVIYDPNMNLRGTIESSTTTAVSWARSIYDEYKAKATQIELDELEPSSI